MCFQPMVDTSESLMTLKTLKDSQDICYESKIFEQTIPEHFTSSLVLGHFETPIVLPKKDGSMEKLKYSKL